MFNSEGNKYWCLLQQRNEINYPTNVLGAKDVFYKRLYSSIRSRKEFIYDFDKRRSRSRQLNDSDAHFHGGIFNLNFNPDGSLLLAATENKAILMFDPFTHELIKTVHNAHDSSLNYIKFLDDRLFASCSDDCTVALWDVRNLKHKLRVFRGHSYWVKNVEYDHSTKVLLSSGYDGCIYMWDINKYTPSLSSYSSNNTQCSKALYLSCLMRMRLTHDNSKMVICTSEGYIMIIHDLDLLELKKDLYGFQSDLYRLMQKGHSCGFDFGSWYNPLFTAKRNRVELISDFPVNNESHSIFSLDVHPHNWCIISRNISRDENTEWTCVHDIQGDKLPFQTVPIDVPKEGLFISHPTSRVTVMSTSSARAVETDTGLLNSNSNDLPLSQISSPSSSSSSTSNSSASTSASVSATSSSPSPSSSSPSSSSSSSSSDMHVSPVVIISARTLNRRAHATILNPNTSYRQIEPGTQNPPHIFKNLKRLTNYCEELNVGHGFIKEVCFSPDGRIICSPYACGFRLLSFNSECKEMPSSVSSTPKPLFELRNCSLHPNLVVTTKFSPTHFMIASGCLSGRVNFYQPIL